MDFFKSVLPPLPKLPKLKKLRQWNGGSLLSLHQFPNLPAAFNLGSGGVTPATSTSAPSTARPNPRSDFVRQHPAPPRQHHMRHSSDISIISSSVSSRTPADYSHRDNLGLYALKCDRSAAKRGILLNLPRKITQAVGGSETPPIGPTPATMVHEKFSPCKRRPIEVPEIKPPPRRRKRSPACDQQTKPDTDLSRWQKNSSELFRIVERESASTARASSAGGVGLMMAKKAHRSGGPVTATKGRTFFDAPTSSSDGAVVELVEQVKAQSVDNLLTMRYHRRRRGAFAEPERAREESDSESSDNRQVQSLRLHQQQQPQLHHQPQHHRRTLSAVNGTVNKSIIQTAKVTPPSGATSLPTTAPARNFPPMDRACDFSIDNNSDEIEVRFRKGYSTDESSETTITEAGPKPDETERYPPNSEKLPLPPRVVQLRRTDSGPSNRAKLTGSPVRTVPKVPEPEPPIVQPDSTKARQFMPLAEVLRKSIDSAELKRKWINDFLSQGSDTNVLEEAGPPVAKLSGCTALEPFVPQLDIVQRMDRQLEELEGSVASLRQGSNGSVDIFRRTNCGFDEFDELFNSAEHIVEETGGRKTVKLSEQITYIDRSSTTSNLCFSSSSFSCASLEDGKPSLPASAPPSVPPPPPPPPPPPIPPAPPVEGGAVRSGNRPTGEESFTGCKSTVKIQDYSSKHLQRVRYLSSPSPSRSSMVEQTLHTQTGFHRWTDSGSDTEHNNENGLQRKANSVVPLNGLNYANDGEDEIPASKNSKSPLGISRQFHVGGEADENGQDVQRKPHATLKNSVGSEQSNEVICYFSSHSRTGEGRRSNSHHYPTIPLDRHPERTGTIEIRSVLLPDYSEYYNEEGVIII
ncbi:uncharacterized protein LOC126568255 [Anopheles maculipalpis]|uniref:uncharacterized protein LOC126568255 n=1 Tax=Anopheles maculipalpis TaxID=1496333 RepID=UPI00215965B2|nr:uncharacterized protein LOC126568255 [Anopheles maculipalpis]